MHRLRSFLAYARVPAAFVAVGLLVAGCTKVPTEIKQAEALECPSGSNCYDPPEPTGPGGTLTVEGGEFYFEILEGAESVQEGAVEISLENVGGVQHNFTIDEAIGNSAVPEGDEDLPPGETSTATLELFAGTYTYYCSVPGHRSAGMEGTIDIAPGGSVEVESGATPTDTAEPQEPEGAATPGEPGAPEGSPGEPIPEGAGQTEGG